MKKIISLLLILFSAGAGARAAVLIRDAFSADGALQGASGGKGFRGSWHGGNYHVADGVVSGAGEAFRMLDAPFGSSGEIWVSFCYGVDKDQEDYGGLSFFEGGVERLIIGDTFGEDVWGMDPKRKGRGKVQSAVSTRGLKRCAARIMLRPGDQSRVDLWIGPDDKELLDLSGRPDLTLEGVSLAGVDRLRIGSEIYTKFSGLVIGECADDISRMNPLGLILASLGGVLLAVRKNCS